MKLAIRLIRGWKLLVRGLFIVEMRKPGDAVCPVCGYYCAGKGGVFCIDKPWLVENDVVI